MAEFDQRFNLRLDSKTRDYLKQLANKSRLTMSEVVRRLVLSSKAKDLWDKETDDETQ